MEPTKEELAFLEGLRNSNISLKRILMLAHEGITANIKTVTNEKALELLESEKHSITSIHDQLDKAKPFKLYSNEKEEKPFSLCPEEKRGKGISLKSLKERMTAAQNKSNEQIIACERPKGGER